MPFKSTKQRKFLHANEPAVAKKFEAEAKKQGKPAVEKKKAKKK